MPQATVVNRELVAVLTRGTLTDAEMLQSTPDAAYLLAITEGPPAAGGPRNSVDAEPVVIGVCAVDAATGHMLLGQWCAVALICLLAGQCCIKTVQQTVCS